MVVAALATEETLPVVCSMVFTAVDGEDGNEVWHLCGDGVAGRYGTMVCLVH